MIMFSDYQKFFYTIWPDCNSADTISWKTFINLLPRQLIFQSVWDSETLNVVFLIETTQHVDFFHVSSPKARLNRNSFFNSGNSLKDIQSTYPTKIFFTRKNS